MGNSNIIAPSSNLEGVERLPIDWEPISFIENRVQRLETINKILGSRGLKPVSFLGDWKNGEIELLKIIGIFDHSARWFTDVQFECRFWTGKLGKFAIKFNANGEISDGAVAYAMVNDKIAVIKQWRPSIGKWTFEIPRGFGHGRTQRFYEETKPQDMELQDFPFDTMLEVIGTEIASFATINKVVVTGNPYENTGVNFLSPTHILIDLTIDKDELEQRLNHPKRFSPYRLYLYSPGEIDGLIASKTIYDYHSMIAHFLASTYIRNNKFP